MARNTGSIAVSTVTTQPNQQQIMQIQRLKVVKSTTEPVPNALVMLGMLVFGLLLALLVMAFFAYAPLLCASWLGIVYVVGLYLSTESNWRWHDAQEFENRFWTVTAFLFSMAVLYIKDSPLAVGRWSPTLGMFLVLSFTAGVHFFDRFIHRKEISRKPRLNTDTTFSQNLFKYKATAEEKAKLVTESVNKIDRILLPSTINNMINLSDVRRQEQKIFRILAGASKDELNFILNNVRLALLFYKVKDHSRLRSDQSRTLILDLLCSKRLADLTVTSRAILLDALMVMKLSAHPYSEKWVRNIILKTSGDDLSKLKTYTDAKGDFHSMHKLVFNDIRDPTIRNDILNHIRREAEVQTAHMRLGTRRAMKRRLQAWRKVLSDVDDTLYSSGGRYPAGVDMRYPRHALYPGVLSFYRELDMGTAGPDEWTDDRVGNLVFLSARPHVYKDMAEKKSYAKFAVLYEMKGMHTLPTMLAGNLTSGRAFMVQGNLAPMAQKKFENFGEYYQLYPEFKHVFVGDNGQGDIRAAELIVEKYGSDALEAAFFHLVLPIEKTFGYHTKEDVERWRKMNIVFFNTYVGAAVEAYKMKKIRLSGLRKICEEAVVTFEEIRLWSTPEMRERMRILLNGDLEHANELLKAKFDPVRLVMKPQIYKLNSKVRTPFGCAIVRKFRGLDGIYQVELIDWTISKNRKRVQAFFPEESIVSFVHADASVITKSNIKYVKFHRAPLARIFPPQMPVKTPFGNGRIVRFRPEDEIYVVSLDGGDKTLNMTGYFCPDAIFPMEVGITTVGSSPRMFAGVRSGIGYITKKLSTFVPGTSGGVKPLFVIGTAVESPFGRGVIITFRPTDRVYELQLIRNLTTRGGVYVQEHYLKESDVTPPRSFFSMLGLGYGSGKNNALAHITPALDKGARVITPYGKGVVLKYRDADHVYELALTDWTLAGAQTVTAYLTKGFIQAINPMIDEALPTLALTTKPIAGGTDTPPTSGGIFQLFRYGFSSSRSGEVATVPYADEGAKRRLETVFGVGQTAMTQPYRGCLKVRLDHPDLVDAVAYVQADGVMEIVAPVPVRKNTLELLGNPFSYLRWGTSKEDGTPGIDSAPKVHQLYPNGSLVGTSFGEGTVAAYRPEDNIYRVNLPSMHGFFCAASLRRPIRGVVGMPVDTIFGSGLLLEIREQDGVHVVTLRHGLMESGEIKAHLQPISVHGPLKAARGDVVMTPFGTGVVINYRPQDGFYCVALEWDLHGQSHVSAFIRERDIVRTGPVEKDSSSCVVM